MKKLILMPLCMIFACKDSVKPTDNVQLTLRIFEAFNAHDWEKMAEYYADSFEYGSPDSQFGTKAELIAYYRKLHEAFPDIHDRLVNIYPSGEHVVVEFVATGSSPEGHQLALPIMGVLTFKSGQVVRDVTYYDL